jgi:hypothetical protein
MHHTSLLPERTAPTAVEEHIHGDTDDQVDNGLAFHTPDPSSLPNAHPRVNVTFLEAELAVVELHTSHKLTRDTHKGR